MSDKRIIGRVYNESKRPAHFEGVVAEKKIGVINNDLKFQSGNLKTSRTQIVGTVNNDISKTSDKSHKPQIIGRIKNDLSDDIDSDK